MSFNDKTTPFSLDEEYEDGFFGKNGEFIAKEKKTKKLSKNDMIYGIWNDEEPEEEEDNKDIFKMKDWNQEKDEKLPQYGNFKKSNHILYEPSKQIQVRYAKNHKKNDEKEKTEETDDKADLMKDLDEETDENEGKLLKNEEDIKKKAEIKRRVFDFKKKHKKQENLENFDFPTALGFQRKKPKIEEKSGIQTSQEDKKLKEQYGIGYKMIRNLGFELGKGLGKEKQGIIKPLEAVQKKAYNSNFENLQEERFQKQKTFNKEPNDVKKEGSDEEQRRSDDETEKIVKRWKKNPKKIKKKVKQLDELQAEKTILQDLPMKIIDMRGPTPILSEGFSSKNEKKGVLAELLMVLKSDYEGNKHKYHDYSRKIRFAEDSIVNNRYEIGLYEGKIGDLEKKKMFFNEILTFFKKNAEIDETIDFLDSLVKRYKKMVMEYEIYLYFLKIFSEKAKISIKLMSLHGDLKAIKPYFNQLYEIFTEIFPKNRRVDPLDFEKSEDSYNKNPVKLIKMAFEIAVLPMIRTYITNEIDITRDSDEMLDFFNDWKLILGQNTTLQVFSQLIEPKLLIELKTYDPASKTKPFAHLWLFPWLDYFNKDTLSQYSKLISAKMIKWLTNWEIHDKMGFKLIKPWKDIMDTEIWKGLINRGILPKLMFSMKEMKIQPEAQDISIIRSILPWFDVLEIKEIEIILENGLLKRLMDVLIKWLEIDGRRIEEIEGWVNGWKGILGGKAAGSSVVGDYFLNMKRLIEERK